MSKSITRAEAVRIAQDTMTTAERERRETATKEARTGGQDMQADDQWRLFHALQQVLAVLETDNSGYRRSLIYNIRHHLEAIIANNPERFGESAEERPA